MESIVVLIGAGQIGQAIARRVGVGKHVVLSDRREANAKAAADAMSNAGYAVSVATVDASSREAVHALVTMAAGIGDITGLVHAAGVSPSQAAPDTVLEDWCPPFPGFFLYYPSRRQQPAGLTAPIDTLRLKQ
jgi:NAD(P)-dependent dehydrogenase (short-subunit alcohol dehydrogenase family)